MINQYGGLLIFQSIYITLNVASSRRLVSWSALQKRGREKLKKRRVRGSEKTPLGNLDLLLSLHRRSFASFRDRRAFYFFIFSRAVFRSAPKLTERLEEATLNENM